MANNLRTYINGSGGSSSGSSSAVGGGVIVGYEVGSYTFDASAQTVTFAGLGTVSSTQVLKILNITDGIIIYDPNDPDTGGTMSSNVLTLDYDTTLMSDSDELQIIIQYNNSADYSTNSELVSVLNPDYIRNTDPEPLISSAQTLSTSFADVGSEFNTSTYKKVFFWADIDIGSDTNIRFKVLAKHTSGSTDEFPLNDSSVIVHTNSTYVAAAASRYFELDDDTDQKVLIEVTVGNAVNYLQLQVSSGTHTDGQLTTVYVTKGY